MSAGGAGEAGWTSARTGLLIDHYYAGLSAAESAALIGGASRNAVISKRRRLGLVATMAIGQGAAASCGDAERRPRPRVERVRLLRGPPPLPVEPLPEMDGPLPLDANPMTLAARPRRGCAWPLGPAEEAGGHRTLFCGAPAAGGKSYCAAHAARAYCRQC